MPVTQVTWSQEQEEEEGDTANLRLLPERYTLRQTLGLGGMGRVLQVHDEVLRRDVAMKIVHTHATQAARSRFVAEAQATAQLEHPGIVPVYDMGWLDVGAAYYTMKIVRGETLRSLIGRAYDGGRHPADPEAPVPLRRLISVLHDVAQAIGYAHERGVLHRDLKPDNILIGDFNETLVVDWGLAKVLGATESGVDEQPPPQHASEEPSWPPLAMEAVATDRHGDGEMATLYGTITGTPAYMAPEQAFGHTDRFGPPLDVFALGAILYELLTGDPPYREDNSLELLAAVMEGPPPSPAEVVDRPLPHELVELCEACTGHDPDRRPPDGRAVAEAIGAWLDGVRRRRQAQALVDRADALAEQIEEKRSEAARRDVKASSLLEGIAPSASVERKRAGWAEQDAALALCREADLLDTERFSALQAALRVAPDHAGAHDRLADIYRAQHEACERDRDWHGAERLEVLLRAHDTGPHAAYLQGTGTLSLTTQPAGAEVTLYRYKLAHRQLVPHRERLLGRTPLRDVELPIGSYLLEIDHPGHRRVRYPVRVDRLGHWGGIAPGASAPTVLRLPPEDELGRDDILVPAGPALLGGGRHPTGEVWVDAFVLRRFPVTNREYVAFLDDLLARGDRDEALALRPMHRGSTDTAYHLEGDRFVLRPDLDGHEWLPDYPVVLVDWHQASAYAAWLADTTDHPWRLPTEVEWEKAARGVDGRPLPWGDHFDPTWCCVHDSHPENPLPQVVDSYPTDCSVYGVRGVSGNVQQWCSSVHDRDALQASDDEADKDGRRVIRGGHWSAGNSATSLFQRFAGMPKLRDASLGFRVAYSYSS